MCCGCTRGWKGFWKNIYGSAFKWGQMVLPNSHWNRWKIITWVGKVTQGNGNSIDPRKNPPVRWKSYEAMNNSYEAIDKAMKTVSRCEFLEKLCDIDHWLRRIHRGKIFYISVDSPWIDFRLLGLIGRSLTLETDNQTQQTLLWSPGLDLIYTNMKIQQMEKKNTENSWHYECKQISEG